MHPREKVEFQMAGMSLDGLLLNGRRVGEHTNSLGAGIENNYNCVPGLRKCQHELTLCIYQA